MFRIEKVFDFSAAHFLDHLPEDHPCSRLHGHNYQVKIVLEAQGLNRVGFVRDYRDLDEFKKWLDKNFDHRSINDMDGPIGNPTAETIAMALYHKAVTLYPEVVAVGVSETPKTWAWYSPDNIPSAEQVLTFLEECCEMPIDAPDRIRVTEAIALLVRGEVVPNDA
jgi:6-pyruvoyltetrahydropterin/6-carboxytetrahydropterin synthase